jgi:hypothetical protein
VTESCAASKMWRRAVDGCDQCEMRRTPLRNRPCVVTCKTVVVHEIIKVVDLVRIYLLCLFVSILVVLVTIANEIGMGGVSMLGIV